MGKLFLLFFAAQAQAGVYQTTLGQNASLQGGDVAIIQSGSVSTAVTCNGPSVVTLPSEQIISGQKAVPFTDLFQNAGDSSRTIECSRFSGDANVEQALLDAKNTALTTCINMGYHSCQPPYDDNFAYSFSVYGNAIGQYGCLVVAHIVGQN